MSTTLSKSISLLFDPTPSRAFSFNPSTVGENHTVEHHSWESKPTCVNRKVDTLNHPDRTLTKHAQFVKILLLRRGPYTRRRRCSGGWGWVHLRQLKTCLRGFGRGRRLGCGFLLTSICFGFPAFRRHHTAGAIRPAFVFGE